MIKPRQPRASTAEPESPPGSAAHESAAKGPLHLPFQPRGAHVVLRAFLGTSVISRRRAPPKKSGVPGVDFFQTRANPGAGSEAHDDKSSPPAGRLARRRAARRKCVAEQNCDFAAAPVRGVQNFNVAASHIAREVTPLRISPEGRRWPRTGGGPKCASMHYFASAIRPGCSHAQIVGASSSSRSSIYG